MKVTKFEKPVPAVHVEDFIPSMALVHAGAESFNHVNDWVKYTAAEDNQVQFCSRLGRQNIPPASLVLLNYIATHFDPNKVFEGITDKAFPDMSHYGGGMMVTPNSKGEGGYLGMHIDASAHALYPGWKREYSVLLGLSEEYDSSFDLLLHNGNEHARVPYGFNCLWAFKCSADSWHGVDKITQGLDRKTLGLMYWSKVSEDEAGLVKAQFNNQLEFK